jgi:hypothetical protein
MVLVICGGRGSGQIGGCGDGTERGIIWPGVFVSFFAKKKKVPDRDVIEMINKIKLP